MNGMSFGIEEAWWAPVGMWLSTPLCWYWQEPDAVQS